MKEISLSTTDRSHAACGPGVRAEEGAQKSTWALPVAVLPASVPLGMVTAQAGPAASVPQGQRGCGWLWRLNKMSDNRPVT